MAHEILFYGLGAFGSILIVFLVFRFILKPIIQTNMEKNQGWYLLGFVISGIFGFFLGRLFSFPVCFNSPLALICHFSIHLVVIVGCCILFWVVTRFKKKET